MDNEKYIEQAVRLKILEEKDRSIEHEINIQLLKRAVNDIRRLGYWLIGTIIVGVALPVTLHSFGLI